MLRRLRLFPVCARKREWPCCQFSDMVLISRRPGDDAWRFREACPDVLRAGSNPSHVWSEKRARVQWMNAAMHAGALWKICAIRSESRPARKRAHSKAAGPAHCFARRGACSVVSPICWHTIFGGLDRTAITSGARGMDGMPSFLEDEWKKSQCGNRIRPPNPKKCVGDESCKRDPR